jgi:alkanesulfonate monooxygenase SsuD/methylene tetrahydromethanopterin reductase-like flavin-dependent oxidoreductase (luciferase family)
MATPTVGLKIPKGTGSPIAPADRSIGSWAALAEDLSYDSVWTSEGWEGSALVELAEAAMRTTDVRLCTAIVNCYSRTPASLAMAAASLSRLSDGRFVLGLGTSHPDFVEELHGMAYDRPVRRVHETIELCKAFTSGADSVTYDGELFQVDGYAAFDTPVPVYNAALGAANRRATGRVADGWIPYLLPLSGLDALFETIADAARAAGRDPDAIEVAPQVLAVVADDRSTARDHLRSFVAPYLDWANYRNALGEHFPEAVEAIAAAREAGDEAAAAANVTDEMLDELAVSGRPEDARDQLRAIIERPGIDTPIVYVPRGVPADLRTQTIEALAPTEL